MTINVNFSHLTKEMRIQVVTLEVTHGEDAYKEEEQKVNLFM